MKFFLSGRESQSPIQVILLTEECAMEWWSG